jgi:hypothetical protein
MHDDGGLFNRGLDGLYLPLSNRWLRWFDSARSLAAWQLWYSFTEGCGSWLLIQTVVSGIEYIGLEHSIY